MTYLKRGKHHKGVMDLEVRLSEKPYVISIETEVLYELGRKKGELDVNTGQGNWLYDPKRYVYYEYKSNHTKKGYGKAMKQCLKWTSAMSKKYPDYLFYGIYVTQNYIKIVSKNHTVRG